MIYIMHVICVEVHYMYVYFLVLIYSHLYKLKT